MSETAPNPVTQPHVPRGYSLLRESAGRLPLGVFAAIEITGEDRKGWLQGQVTNDLRELRDGGSIQFCICTPTGQLLADGTLWSLPNRYIMTVPATAVEAVLQRFESLVILEDVTARPLSQPLVSIQGPQASRLLAEFGDLPKLDAGTVEVGGAEVLFLRSNRAGFGGWDLLAEDRKVEAKIEARFDEVSAEAYEVARLEAGVPAFGRDTGPKTLPPELGNAYVARHISYSKGCYTGQEVIMRIYSRGHTNKTWVGLLADRPMPEGARISLGKAEVGSVSTSAWSPTFGYIAGAWLRNEAATAGEVVTVHAADQMVDAEVEHMPLLRLG